MGQGMRRFWLAGAGVVAAALLGWWALEARDREADSSVAAPTEQTSEGPAWGEQLAEADDGSSSDGASEAERSAALRDREIFTDKLAFARADGLRDLPIGDIIAQLGRTFVGTRYEPGTLEVPGPERLVINLRELDCVTFIENTLAISRLVRAGNVDFDAFQDALTTIRYRDGELDGYGSRLHYFSEWITDNERKAVVRDITGEIGGVLVTERIDFMSTHPEAYEQLADPANLAAIREVEARLNDQARYYIPQDRIAEVAPLIRDGDIIAATSTVKGLDVAHTGIALWVDGQLHLLHAPLVGSSVEISEVPLADRIRNIPQQDGIMVARPY